MIICQLNHYLDDKSLLSAEFRGFHSTEKDIYPSITLCFNDFVRQDVNLPGKTFNYSRYKSFLSGSDWDERMLELDYDNATLQLEDKVLQTMVLYNSKKKLINILVKFMNSSEELRILKLN